MWLSGLSSSDGIFVAVEQLPQDMTSAALALSSISKSILGFAGLFSIREYLLLEIEVASF